MKLARPGGSMRGVIAVVDDNELTRVLVADALSELRYEPALFGTCAEALAALARRPPSACLVDHLLPGMTGADFVRAVRASAEARLRALPIVAFTARFEREMLEAGADACVRKPFKLPALGAALAQVVPEAPATAAAPVPGVVGLLEPLAALHAGARARTLDSARLVTYRELRADLSRLLARAQEAGGGPRRRGALRVRAVLPVVLERGERVWRGTTGDVGAGGFSSVLPGGLAPGDDVEFRLLAPRRALRGRARVASVAAAGQGRARVGVQFVDLPQADREEAEALVLDRVLAPEPPPRRQGP